LISSLNYYFLDQDKGKVIQFNRNRYSIWDLKGGPPVEEGKINEKPIAVKTTEKPVLVTEHLIETTTEMETNKPKSFIYTNENYLKLCSDPTIEAADSNLNGSEIYLFKQLQYWVLTG
jgi:hypothetical protein